MRVDAVQIIFFPLCCHPPGQHSPVTVALRNAVSLRGDVSSDNTASTQPHTESLFPDESGFAWSSPLHSIGPFDLGACLEIKNSTRLSTPIWAKHFHKFYQI